MAHEDWRQGFESVRCGHRDCWRLAVRIVSYESPRHREFKGQTHDCCAVHSKAKAWKGLTT